MKRYYKKIIAIVLLLAILCFTPELSFALYTNGYEPERPDNYVTVIKKVAPVMKILLNIGITVGAVGLTLLGFRYMLGSASEKAEYKETFGPFIVGAIFMFSVSSILRIIANIF